MNNVHFPIYNQSDREVHNGYGEFVPYRQVNGVKTPLSKVEFNKAYSIIDKFTYSKLKANEYEDRYSKILKCIQDNVSFDCNVAFIPRTLCELILVRKCLEEENKGGCGVRNLNREILKNGSSVEITDDEIVFALSSVSKSRVKQAIKAKKCWHRCYFDDQGDNNHPDVIKIAYKLHKEILKNQIVHQAKSITLDVLKKYAEQELQQVRSFKWIVESDQHDQLILKCIAVECSPLSHYSVLLYRGGEFDKDNCDKTDKPHSLSYGTGLFSGYLYESGEFGSGAMPFTYMRTKDAYILPIPIDDFKSSIFHIPSTNTFCQFAGYGEFFHARSKIWSGGEGISGVSGMESSRHKLFDQLVTSSFSKEEFIRKFKQHYQQAIMLKS